MDIERKYTENDMVKIGCHDCKGCSACCRDMGQSIVINPFDIWQLEKGLNRSMEQLLTDVLELHVEDGLILPNLRMTEKNTGEVCCSFLNEGGRCDIHDFRPGICRLFPLGRNYEENKISYFVLENACPAPNKTKIKISKWLNHEQPKKYQHFLLTWHGIVKNSKERLLSGRVDDSLGKQWNMLFLQTFYLRSYTGSDFYQEFENRLPKWETLICKAIDGAE